MVRVLKSVEPVSAGKILGALYFGLSLIVAPFLIIGSIAGFSGSSGQGFPFFGSFGVAFAIAVPFIYGFLGFVVGALFAFLYNLAAKWTGGIEMEID